VDGFVGFKCGNHKSSSLSFFDLLKAHQHLSHHFALVVFVISRSVTVNYDHSTIQIGHLRRLLYFVFLSQSSGFKFLIHTHVIFYSIFH